MVPKFHTQTRANERSGRWVPKLAGVAARTPGAWAREMESAQVQPRDRERDEWSASRTEFPSGFMSGRSTPPKNASKTSTLPKIATPLAELPHVAHFSVKISQPGGHAPSV